MPISVTLPTWIPRNRVITFDDGALESCGVTIPYSEVTGLRLFSVNPYNHGSYIATKYTIEITAERGQKIKCQYSDGQGTPGAEAYKLTLDLVRYYIASGSLNRLVARVQNPKETVKVGPLAVSTGGIKSWKFGVIPQSLSWEHFAGCKWVKGRIQILQKRAVGAQPTVWWPGRYDTKLAIILSDFLLGCYRALVLGDHTPFVHTGPAPQPSETPELRSASEALSHRPIYHHRVGMKVGLYLIAMVVCAVIAAIGAGLLAFLSIMGWYWFIFVPLFVSLVVVVPQVFLLKWVHCRNGWAAVFFGLLMTIIFYFGQYYIVMVYFNPADWIHPERTVDQFIYEMSHTVISNNGVPESSPNPVVVMLFTIIELGIVFMLFMISAIGQAAAPYCEESRNWMRKEVARFPSERAKDFLLAFSQLNGNGVNRLPYKQTHMMNSPHTRVAVEYSPRFEGREPLDVYLSVGQRQTDGILQPPGANKKDVIQRIRFTRAEIEQVLPIFKFSAK